VVCGGAPVSPGDLIIGDRNGVVVIRPGEAEEVMERALDKRRRQEETIRRMKETGKVMPRILKSL
jgi:regulator of RNase E activity RraA